MDRRRDDRPDDDIRDLPASIDAEMGLLSWLLVDNRSYEAVAGFLRPWHFFDALHRRVFEGCATLISRGQRADPFSLRPVLGDDADPAYFAELVENHMPWSDPEDYGRLIRDLAQRRALILDARQAAAEAARGWELGDAAGNEIAARLRGALETRGDNGETGAIDPTSWEGEAIPVRKWVVKDWIPDGYVTGLYGDGGIGKTILAQQIQTACALGTHWIGLEVPRIPTLGIYCEDKAEELHIRQAAINAVHGCSMRDLDGMHILGRHGMDNILMDFEGWQGRGTLTPFFHMVVAKARAAGAKLVIVDNIMTTFGGEENRKAQVRQYVDGCLGRIANEIGGAVLALGHPSATGMASGEGTSGTVGWNAAFRSRLYFQRDKGDKEDGVPADSNIRILSRKKANMASVGDEIEVLWKDGAFEPTQSVVFTGTVARIEKGNVKRLVLDEMTRLIGLGETLSPKKKAGNYFARLLMLQAAINDHRPRLGNKALEQAYMELLDEGAVVIREEGPPSRRFQILTIPGVVPGAVHASSKGSGEDLFDTGGTPPKDGLSTPSATHPEGENGLGEDHLSEHSGEPENDLPDTSPDSDFETPVEADSEGENSPETADPEEEEKLPF